MELEGRLTDFSLEDIIKLLNSGKKTGVLNIQFVDEEGREKKIALYFKDGKIIHSTYGTLTGIPVLEELACVSQGQFIFSKGDISVQNDNDIINKKFDELIEIYKKASERWRPLQKLFPSINREITLSEASEGKIDFTREEWKIITSIGNGSTIKALIEKTKMSKIKLLEILKHLKEKGVIEIKEQKQEVVDKSLGTIVPAPLRPEDTWFGGKPIGDKTASKLYKIMDGRKTLLELAKKLNISIEEAKKALDYLISIERATIVKK